MKVVKFTEIRAILGRKFWELLPRVKMQKQNVECETISS